MSSLLSRLGLVKINKNLISSKNKINNLKLKIEEKITSAQNKFIYEINKKKKLEKELRIKPNTSLIISLSKEYYKDIEKIFNEYNSVSSCRNGDFVYKQIKNCEEDKINYYKMLISLLNSAILIDKVKESLYKDKNINYENKITEYIHEKTEYLKGKKQKHCESFGKEKCNSEEQSGGKKITKKTIKKDTKKSVKK